MNKRRKILQVLLQILLLPVYCFLEVFGFGIWIAYILCLVYIDTYFLFILLGGIVLFFVWRIGAFVLGYFLFKIKNIEFVYELRKTGKKIPITRKERHKISLNNPWSYNKGSYEGYYETKQVVGYEEEKVETPETLQTQTVYLTFFTFAIPIGIIKLVLSIIACFTNKFNIVIRKPKNSSYSRDNVAFFYFGYVKKRI